MIAISLPIILQEKNFLTKVSSGPAPIAITRWMTNCARSFQSIESRSTSQKITGESLLIQSYVTHQLLQSRNVIIKK